MSTAYYLANKADLKTKKREYYAAHKARECAFKKADHQEHKQARLASKKERRTKTQSWLAELKRGPCEDCGQLFPECCMQFHHLVPRRLTGRKHIHKNWSKERIEAELEHCVRLCACCHCIRDAESRLG